MTRPQRPCLDCGALTRNPRGRCRPCQQKRDHARNEAAARQPYFDPTYRKIRAAVRRGQYGGCVDCGTYDDLTVDHRTPLSAGGTNAWSNLVVRCRACNSRKGARPGQETRG